MKKQCLALLLILALLPGAALAAEIGTDATYTLSREEEAAFTLLEQVFNEADPAKAIELILQAAEAAPNSSSVQISCAQLLFYLDSADTYAEDCEAMLQKGLELAQTEDDEVYALQAYSEQLTYWERADEAVTMLADAIKRMPENEPLKTALATTHYYEGDTDKALALLTELVEDSPRNLEARRLHATVLLDTFQYDDALAAYKQIAEGWPEYLDGLYGQCATYIAMGDFEMGVRAIDLLLSSGGDESLWLERANIRLFKQQDPEAALTECEALLRSDPESIDAAAVKLVALVSLERFEEAHDVAGDIAKLDENYAARLDAITNMSEGDWTQAEETLLALQKRLPSSPLVDKSLATVRLDGFDDLDGAMDYIQEAFDKADGIADVELYTQLGHNYVQQHALLEAARAYSFADPLTYDDPLPLYYVACVLMDANRMDDAADILAQMNLRYPGWYETMLIELYVQRANQDAEGALETYEAISAKFPFQAGRMTSFEAILLAEAGDPKGAEMLKEILDDDPDGGTATAWDDYAYALMILEDLDGAREALDTAKESPYAAGEGTLAIRNEQVALLLTEGELLMREGDVDGSVATFTEAAELGWMPYGLEGNPDYTSLETAEGYDALIAYAPELDTAWDLSVLPTIPGAKAE